MQSGDRRPRQGAPRARDRRARRADGPGGGRGGHPVPPLEPQQGAGGAGSARAGRPRGSTARRCRRRFAARTACGWSRTRSSTCSSTAELRRGVVLARGGGPLRAGAVVLTTGTFLRGIIHIGETAARGGAGRRPGRGAAGGADTRPRPPARAAEDRHAAAARRPQHRLDARRAAGWRRGRRCCSPSCRARRRCGRSTAASPQPTSGPTRSSARTCTARRCTAARSNRRVRDTVRRSRTRWCASPSARRIRSSSSRRVWTTARSTRTASRRRCPEEVQGACGADDSRS